MATVFKRQSVWALSLLLGAVVLISLQPVFAHDDMEDGTTTIDTDGDGYYDCVEKGRYRDDMDNDGIDDDEDDTVNDLQSTQDRDVDGIPDYIEKSEYRRNHDNTGKDDAEDLDDDDDGIRDRNESADDKKDHDNTGKADKRDLDDDNDGIADLDEATCGKIFDEDNDGTKDKYDDDSFDQSIEEEINYYYVEIEDSAFTTSELTIQVGDTVKFKNRDSMEHTATALDGSFDTGTISPGEYVPITFTETGTFEYYCEVHGMSMTGTIIVTE